MNSRGSILKIQNYFIECAEVVELVDTLDLGSSAVRCGGSSPLFGTLLKYQSQTILPVALECNKIFS